MKEQFNPMEEKQLTSRDSMGYSSMRKNIMIDNEPTNEGKVVTAERPQNIDIDPTTYDNPELRSVAQAVKDAKQFGVNLTGVYIDELRHRVVKEANEGRVPWDKAGEIIGQLEGWHEQRGPRGATEPVHLNQEEGNIDPRAVRRKRNGKWELAIDNDTKEKRGKKAELTPAMKEIILDRWQQVAVRRYKKDHNLDRLDESQYNLAVQELTPEELVRRDRWELPMADEEKKGVASATHLDEIEERVKKANNLDEVSPYLQRLLQLVSYLDDLPIEGKYDEYLEKIKKIFDANRSGNLDEVKTLVQNLITEIKPYPIFRLTEEEAEERDIPKSLEDLVLAIMRSEGDEWRHGGTKELIDIHGNINSGNVLAWFRDRMWWYHDFTPRGEVDLFQQISVPMLYRSISLSEMIYFARYFRKRVYNSTVKDDRTKKIYTLYNYEKDEGYEKLKEQLMYEVWLFNKARNFDVKYWAAMGDIEALSKELYGIYADNSFTRSGNMQRPFSMPGFFEMQNIMDKHRDKAEGKEAVEVENEYSYSTGDAMREALLVYYHLTDIEKLRELLGDDSVFFQRDYYKRNDRDITKDFGQHGNDWNEEWFEKGEKGKLKFEKDWVKGQFTEYVNIFNNIHKDPATLAEVKEKIRQHVMQKLQRRLIEQSIANARKKGEEFVLDDTAKERIRQRAYDDAMYAEEYAFVMCRWTGIQAKNDTAGAGYDAWSKGLQNVMRYRLGQAGKVDAEGKISEKGRATGNIYNIFGLKKLGLNFFTGFTTNYVDKEGDITQEGKKPLTIEVLEAMHNEEKKLEDKGGSTKEMADKMKKLIGTLDYDEMRMNKFIADHINRGFTVFNNIIDANEIDFSKFVKIEPLRGAVIDIAGLTEAVQKKIITPIGYLYSTWEIQYDRKIRDLVTRVEKEDFVDGDIRKWVEYKYDDKEIASTMLGEEILEAFKNPDGSLNYKGIQDNRGRMFKYVLRYVIAAQIYAHRNFNSPYPRYNTTVIEPALLALQKIPGLIPGSEGGEKSMKDVQVLATLFDKNDINWIRNHADAQVWKVLGEDVLFESFIGGSGGFFKSLGIFFGGLFKE